ncbi:hypothetical protein TIFTF001_031073 [Ficus carica]|uniref:Uncharacterized protein n=1 Tax=Ficus carica TaxID=3494 RepID=A0AA88DUD0_FICCA|nr:hypothetical protein TIFTF001_031073 [Ficus carica]
MGGLPRLDLEVGAGLFLADSYRVLRVVATQAQFHKFTKCVPGCSRHGDDPNREGWPVVGDDLVVNISPPASLGWSSPGMHAPARSRTWVAGGKANRDFGLHAALRGWREGERAPGNSNFELKREVEPGFRTARGTPWLAGRRTGTWEFEFRIKAGSRTGA